MPTFETRTIFEGFRNLRAYLRLDAGVLRGPLPPHVLDDGAFGEKGARMFQQRQQLEQARLSLAKKDEQISRLKEELAGTKDAGVRAAGPAKAAIANGNPAGTAGNGAGKAISGDPRNHFIGEVVSGNSFADIGGLYGTVNEKVSVAHGKGATALTMMDALPEGHRLWRAFEDRMQSLEIPNVQTISGNILELGESSEHPQYDVVHCTGVLYHMPDPLRLLSALRKITRKHLVLGSAVTAPRVAGEGETLELPSAASLFVPALQGRERAIVEAYWRPFVGDKALGLTREADWNTEDYGPWWWLPTVDAMKAMCESAGFDFEDGAHYWNGNSYVMLLSRRS